MSLDDLLTRMKAGDRRAVARLITLAENDIEAAKEISLKIFKETGKAYIIGVTGAPGSGKSALTNQLISLLLEMDLSVGVIAVDPTSPFSGGALLGDRIRMKENYSKDKVFIRSMANRGQLGGIARATKDIISILDASGFNVIIIETVGVGQSEVDVYNTAHTTLVLVVPGMGDDIQTFKAGIMEICDIFVVNKMDHDGAEKLVNEIDSMLDLNERINVNHEDHDIEIVKSKDWRVPVVKTNALTGEGVKNLWDNVEKHRKYLNDSGKIKQKLINRFRKELLDILKEKFRVQIEDALDPDSNKGIDELLGKIINRLESPYLISDEISKIILKNLDS
ncbi:MAG: methylmalonyl Co-A mutase-associated GTPase MeaB [Candidatus Hodarchaeota archaeon]